MEYVTKKIPKYLEKKIARLKAIFQIKKEKKVTEGEVIALAIAMLEEDVERESRYSLAQLVGLVKGGKKSRPDEIDSIIYGI